MPEEIVSRILRLPGYGVYAWEAEEATNTLQLRIRQTAPKPYYVCGGTSPACSEELLGRRRGVAPQRARRGRRLAPNRRPRPRCRAVRSAHSPIGVSRPRRRCGPRDVSPSSSFGLGGLALDGGDERGAGDDLSKRSSRVRDCRRLSDVGGVAHGGVRHAATASDVAGNHRPVVEPDAHAQRGHPAAARSAFHASSAASMPRAQASASVASRGPVSGTPKVASSASPMNFSRQPLWRNTTSSIRPWKSRSRAMTSSGVISSAMVVKPTRSAKSTPTAWRRTRPSGSSRSAKVSTTLGEK